MADIALKQRVHDYWNDNVCDTKEHLIVKGTTKDAIPYPKYSREYFEEIECRRVASPIFARPEQYRDKKVLEVGVGSGVDFVQWVRHGAEAYGVDLTEEAIDHTQHWLAAYNLEGSDRLRVADAESLPFPDDTFDLTYSWGVLHHTPDTLAAIRECVRVARKGGEVKLMLYNSRSLLWAGTRLLKALTGKDVESPGTKAFTRKWVKELEDHLWCWDAQHNEIVNRVWVEEIDARTCEVDLVKRYGWLVSSGLRLANWALGNNSGFFMTIRLRKVSN